MSAASRFRAPEVLQTSEMDCGPAALASLLGMFGLGVDLGALREVCATDVDGTSIDVLEEVAAGLGLDAEQVVVPWEQVRAAPQLYLPALLLTRTPSGLAHVVCAWRARRGRVDLVDPAVGRRRVRWSALAEEAFVHELEAPRQAWDGYALSEDAAAALVARLQASGVSESQARERAAAAQRGGGLEGGVGDLLAELDGAGNGVEEPAPAVSPSSTAGMVHVRGAILVRARGAKGEAHRVPASLRRVLAGETEGPLPALARLVGLRRRGSLLAALTAALAAAAGVAEVLAARQVLESGFGGGRLVGLAAALAVAILASAAFALQVSAIGRRVEAEMLATLFERAGRFGEVFSRTRPAGDLAERTHALRELREAIELAGLGVQRSLELVLACAAIVVVAPAAWPAAAALLGIGALAPWSIVRTLREVDLRSRALGGVLAQLLTDALGGMWAVRAHRGGAVVRAWQAPLIAHWKRASASLATRNAITAGLLSGPALLIAVVAAALAAGSGAGAPAAFIVLALGFTAAASIGDVTIATRRLVSLRSVIARLLDALNAPLLDPAPLPPSTGAAPGVAIAIDGADVVLGGNPVLSGVDLDIAPGEHVAVVGISGAGKSTLIALLGGWLTPASGSLLVDGDQLAGTALAALRAAAAWSDPGARLRDVSPLENAADGSATDAPPAAERIAAVGLPPGLLDGGSVGEAGGRLDGPDAQRLRLARALGRPHARLVLLDEALRGLPRDERRQLLAHLRGIWREATLLHVTHDPEEALGFDRVLVVADGRLAEDGDPGELAGRPDSLLRGLLDAHATVERRLADPARWRPLADPARWRPLADPPGWQAPEPAAALDESAAPSAGTPHRPSTRAALLALASLAAAFAATGLLFLSAIRLGNGLSGSDPGDLGWLPGSLALLLAAALASALGLLADGRLTLRVGGYLRRRALVASLAGDPERLRGEGIGIRLGRVLDLEALERAAQGTGTVLAVGAAELIGAAIALTITVSALALAPLALALAACATLAFLLTRATREENRRRQDLGARLLDLLLGYRAATIFAGPDGDAHRPGMAWLRRAERRGDAGRAALVTSIPRVGTLALIGVLAIDPPATPGAVAAALGATLLALTGLERVALALADLAIAAAAWQEARPLLEIEGSTPGHPMPAAEGGEPAARRRRGSEALLAVGNGGSPAAAGGRAAFAPAPGEDVLFHQPLVANALLATDRWPPRDEDWEALAALLEPLALAGVAARMPNGIAQPLGETGWRLSEGERARFSLLRALLAEPTDLLADDTLAALDAHTAHRVLDHLEGLEASVTCCAGSNGLSPRVLQTSEGGVVESTPMGPVPAVPPGRIWIQEVKPPE